MPPTSWVWKHVKRENDKIACSVCGDKLSDNGGTSTIAYHLEKRHLLKNPEKPDTSRCIRTQNYGYSRQNV